MRKIVLASVALLAMTTISEAQNRHRHHHHGYHHGYHHRPPMRQHYHPPRYNAAPWIAGAIGLGVLGALTYDAWGRPYRPVCYNEYIGLDRYGNQVYQQRCE